MDSAQRKKLFDSHIDKKTFKKDGTKGKYKRNITSNVVTRAVKHLFHDKKSIFDLSDLDQIEQVREEVSKSSEDKHNDYSTPINHYKELMKDIIGSSNDKNNTENSDDYNITSETGDNSNVENNTGNSGNNNGANNNVLPTNLEPLNLIIYGAPGTGKSWELKDRLEKGKICVADVYRTTFHPDTDYSTFVGCFKPSMSQNNDIIVYEFVPQIFLKAYMKAWEEYFKVNSQSNEDYPDNKIPNSKHVYLVIEEINRGNCAQIFGDIFQLLDRDEKGFSEYAIIPDQDIKDFYMKNNNLWNKIKDELIKNNKIQQSSNEFYLAFPPNFHIWATMNTSDQSLYPMDSAFKRRWDWEYVKIDPKNKSKLAKNLDFYTSKSWPEVIEAINKMIKVKTKSADKQIGDYFIKTKNSQDITFKDFRNKVLFYLFNDVFKDNYNFGKEFFGNNNDDFLFEDLLNKEDDEQKTIVNNWFNNILGIQPKSTTSVNTDDSDNQDGQQTDSNNQDGQQTDPSTPNEGSSDEL